jgi:ubiquinone/menaquinone biosynthesis C-methylase UbiE
MRKWTEGTSFVWLCAALWMLVGSVLVEAQEKSVKPGINDTFIDPKVEEYIEKFEIESREVFHKRAEILEACSIPTGSTIADIGAGTGLFTRMFSKSVGLDGRIVAVDIAKNFLDHIAKSAREQNLRNIDTLLCSADSTELPEASVDFAFICDTYHHFEFPTKTMKSLYRALKPGGRVVVIDFKRVEGESTAWVMSHVRAGQQVFEKEILDCGFVKLSQKEGLLKENYFLEFQKPK